MGRIREMIHTVIHVGIVSLHNNISLCTHLTLVQHVFGRTAEYSLRVLGTKQYFGFVLSILASHNLKSKLECLHSSLHWVRLKWLLFSAYYVRTLVRHAKVVVLYSLPYTYTYRM